jgi:AraC-like DNA-binding protein
MRNKANIHRFPRFHNLELLIAEFADQRFDAHWHDTWSVGVVLSGAHDNSAKRNGEGLVTTGQITAIPPGEVHAGMVVGEKACTYLMLYPSHEVVMDAFEQNGSRISSLPSAGFANRDLANALITLAGTMTNEASSGFDCEVVWASFLDALTMAIVDHARQRIAEPARSKPLLAHAREYLHAHPAEQIRLDELARASGLSKFYLCRQFSAEFGLSPNRYHRQLRLQMARRLLLEGMPVASVALECGFADQAHLGRQFRMSYGVTPGSFGMAHH